jgi:cell division protein FtsB
MEKAVTVVTARRSDLDRMFWVLLAAGLLLFAIVTLPPGAARASAMGRDVENTRRIVAQLEQANDVLSQRERALQSDPFYEEMVLRSKMKYTRPGEKEIQTTLPGRTIAMVEAPAVDVFVPSPAPAAGLAAQVINWALLAASTIMVAAAFILFDQPSRALAFQRSGQG